jgi:hypothetical protein
MVERSIPCDGDLKAWLKCLENAAEYLEAVAEEHDPAALGWRF